MRKIIPKISHLKYLYNHPLAIGLRLKIFSRYFSFHILNRHNDEVIIPFLGNKLIIKKGQGGQGNYFTYLNDYEEMLFLAHYLKSSDIFIDAGANVGSYSMLAAVTKFSTVHAFEPNSIFFKILEKNILINNLQNKVTAHYCALGEKYGSVHLINKGALSHISHDNTRDSEKVELKRLDSIVTHAHVMKIDVEGYEHNMLIGSEKIMENSNLNVIIIEMASYNRYDSSDHKVHSLITNYGFSPIFYNPKTRMIKDKKQYTKGGKGWWNVIYIRDRDLVLDRINSSKKIKVNGRWY